jgi:hypothetical protein
MRGLGLLKFVVPFVCMAFALFFSAREYKISTFAKKSEYKISKEVSCGVD